jgi:serine protein kinase
MENETTTKANRLAKLVGRFDKSHFQKINEEMSFSEYVDNLYLRPKLVRSAYQYLYDMILEQGTEKVEQHRKTYIHYDFFDDPDIPIFGLEETLHQLVQFFKGAAGWYGPERRVLLLHGPVGSSKSTILRCLKRGMEKYSKTDAGAWYSFRWTNLPKDIYNSVESDAPMHEDPSKLLPMELRVPLFNELNKILLDQTPEGNRQTQYRLVPEGDLNPRSKTFLTMLLKNYEGDLGKILNEHIRVIRKIHSEAERVGIATFQPKDEKNQDSTELTGDIDWSKLPHFGSDSDSRAFNFDGEFCCGNRGVVEFIEVLKLAKEFLYDLLGASQERSIKPKKFSQVSVDTVLIGHSVSGTEPIVYRKEGNTYWTTLDNLYEEFHDDVKGLQVLAHDFEKKQTTWTPVREITRHRWDGRLVKTRQRWGEVETTPNHALFDRSGNLFMPEDCKEVMAVRQLSEIRNGNCVDLLKVMPKGFFCDRAGSMTLGHTKPPKEGKVRSVRQRAATSITQQLTGKELESFLTFLVFYVTEGHTTETGVVISQKDRTVLERLSEDVNNFCDANGHIQYVQQDQCHRLIYNVFALRDIAETMGGSGCLNKRLPDFVFDMNVDYIHHVLEVLKITDGGEIKFEGCSDEYRESSLDYKTTSSLLASQVGYLLTRVGKDYSVRFGETITGKPSYGVRVVQGSRKSNCQKRVEHRLTQNEWVYDVGCENIRNFACGVGLVIAHNTNNPEYVKLKTDQTMEALRDRTVKIDVPYLLRHSKEQKILEHYYGKDKVKQHIAPHTLEIAALWAVLTRLEDDKDGKITLVEKAKLYDGKQLPGWTQDAVKEMMDKYPHEGMSFGVSCRYVQDKVSNCLSSHYDYINTFMVLNELKAGIEHQSLFDSEEDKARYITCIDYARKELDEILKSEVQKALVGDEDAVIRLCAQYIDNVMAFIENTKIKDPFTGQDREPDERLMRSIEEKIDIPEVGADDFRRMLAAFIGKLHHKHEEFKWDSNPQLKKALEAKLFEDTKDHIKLSALNVKGAAVVDKGIQEKIDAIKQRLIKQHGYNEQSATDVLDYVASIFARGDASDDD